MKILILSWRDIKHPYGGGAELLSHEMARRWTKWGYEATHFSAFFPGAKAEETINGVLYKRAGSWYSVHLIAFWKIITHQLGEFDVIVDEVHGFPFFAALYTRNRVVCLACEVAKEVWDQMYSFPLNVIGKLMEKIYLFIYKEINFLTISPSTKIDLIRAGIKPGNIVILPMGFTISLPAKIPSKLKNPTIIFLGRLAKTKGIEDAIQAFSIIAKSIPKARMWIVGKGVVAYERKLKRTVKNLKLNNLEFRGFVSEKEKCKLLARAHLILVPSTREGWGLIVPEANIVGTPAIVYNSPGLRDVTKTGRNGIVLRNNTPEELAEESISMILNKKKYQKISESSKKFARALNWDDTAKTALEVMKKMVLNK